MRITEIERDLGVYNYTWSSKYIYYILPLRKPRMKSKYLLKNSYNENDPI